MSEESTKLTGKKRRRSSAAGGIKKKRKRSSGVAEPITNPDVSLEPVKKKSRYEMFLSNHRYEPASGDPVMVLEDIQDKNTELWLFQLPKNFDLKQLDGVTVDLERTEGSEIGHVHTDNDKDYTFYESGSNEHSKLINIFPTKDNAMLNSYKLGKPFTRQINVSESVVLPKENTKMEERKSVAQIEGLGKKGPFKPFGYEGDVSQITSVSIISHKKKQRRSTLGIGTPKKTKRRSSTKVKKEPTTPKKERKEKKERRKSNSKKKAKKEK